MLGAANPLSFSRGKRGIAGSMVFVIFDRAALYGLMQKARYARKDYGNDPSAFVGDEETGERMAAVGTIGDLGLETAVPVYPDQLLPFDITVTGRNELGQAMSMSIYGVEILNHGQGISTEDLTIEDQYTFVASNLIDWVPAQGPEEQANDIGGQFGNTVPPNPIGV